MTTIVNKPSESLHARVPQELLKELDKIAMNLGRSRNWVLNEALKQYLDVQQWQIELIEQRLSESEDSEAKYIDHDELMKKHEKHLKKKLNI